MAMNKINFGSKPPATPTEAFASMMSGGAAVQKDIQEIPISQLIPFEGQPFKPYPKEKLVELAEDIKQNGVLVPVIVRPYVGRYQILAGHNRTDGSKLAGKDTVPCIIKDVDDNTARLIVVNTNLNQREELLPSEKAFAYKMQLDALAKGATNGRTSAEVEMETGENKRQIQRFIRLTYIIKPLLDMTDEKQIPFRAAVELSYLKESEQSRLLEYLGAHHIKTISLDQAGLLKMHSKDENFGYTQLDEVFGKQPTEEPKAAKKKILKIKYDRLGDYIKPETPPEEAETYILKALAFYEDYKRKATGIQ